MKNRINSQIQMMKTLKDSLGEILKLTKNLNKMMRIKIMNDKMIK